MQQKSPERRRAFDLFFQTELTQQQIADMLNINRKTLFGWIKAGGWNRVKYTAAHAPSVLIEQYYEQLAAINMHIAQRSEQPWPTKEESEIIRRLTTTIRQIRNGKQTASECIDVFQAFTDKLGTVDMELTAALIPHMTTHISSLTEKGKFFSQSQLCAREDQLEKEFAEMLTGEAVNEPVDTPENDIPATGSIHHSDRATDGVTPGDEATVDPLPIANIETTDNMDLSTKNNEDEASVPHHPAIGPGSIPYSPWSQQETDKYTRYLEEKYRISHDPYVTRTGNITIIRHPSPLWGKGRSLFF